MTSLLFIIKLKTFYWGFKKKILSDISNLDVGKILCSRKEGIETLMTYKFPSLSSLFISYLFPFSFSNTEKKVCECIK